MMNRKRLLVSAVGALLAAAIAGGVAYATIPGPSNVYSACMLKGLGTIRLIDKSLPSTNLMSHCTDKETEISWNQAGQPGPAGPQGAKGEPGAPGTNGTNGTDGKDGVSVTTASEPAGANCTGGGVQLTAVKGVSYVCNGNAGADGKDGTNGTNGADGRRGATGPQGPNGAPGATGPGGPPGQRGDRGPTGPAGPPGAGVPSLDSLQGLPCNNGGGTVNVAYGSWTGGTASITLACVGVSRTLTVATSLQGGASGTVTSSPAGINCPGTCSTSFPNGTPVTLTASSAIDDFTGWSGDCSGGGTCQLTMDASKNATASFARSDKVLTVNTSFDGASGGTVTSSPSGISCPGTCTATFPTGTLVTLTTTSGSVFTGWSGDCSGDGSCQLTMDAAKNATASFAEGEYLTLTMMRSSLYCFWLGLVGGCAPNASISSYPAGLACGPFDNGDPYHAPPDPQSITCTGRWLHDTPVTLTSTTYGQGTYTPVWLGACSFNVGSTCSVGWGSRFETATAQYSYP